KPKLPPSIRIAAGAVQPGPLPRRQTANPCPYCAPTVKLAFLTPGTITTHSALAMSSCGTLLSGAPLKLASTSAAALSLSLRHSGTQAVGFIGKCEQSQASAAYDAKQETLKTSRTDDSLILCFSL